jgi:hypothetical protein
MPLFAKILSGLLGLSRLIALPMQTGEAGNKAAGALNGIGTLGAAGAAALWVLGPGREWQITLNALELSGITLAVVMLVEWARSTPPSGGA